MEIIKKILIYDERMVISILTIYIHTYHTYGQDTKTGHMSQG